ncbi:hypothetical protein HDU96_001112 [Phlyctochytrium bullatum]|nr:hypothetical protein HDU96_001112 [Phlyctochytrium bullatum]
MDTPTTTAFINEILTVGGDASGNPSDLKADGGDDSMMGLLGDNVTVDSVLQNFQSRSDREPSQQQQQLGLRPGMGGDVFLSNDPNNSSGNNGGSALPNGSGFEDFLNSNFMSTSSQLGESSFPSLDEGSSSAFLSQNLSILGGTVLGSQQQSSVHTSTSDAAKRLSGTSITGVTAASDATARNRLMQEMEQQAAAFEELDRQTTPITLPVFRPTSPSTRPINPLTAADRAAALSRSPRTSPYNPPLNPPIPTIEHTSPLVAFGDPVSNYLNPVGARSPNLSVDMNLLTKPQAAGAGGFDLTLSTPTGTVYNLDQGFTMLGADGAGTGPSPTNEALSGSQESNLSGGSSKSNESLHQLLLQQQQQQQISGVTPSLSHSPSVRAIESGLDDLSLVSHSPQIAFTSALLSQSPQLAFTGTTAATTAAMMSALMDPSQHLSPQTSPLLNTGHLSPYHSPFMTGGYLSAGDSYDNLAGATGMGKIVDPMDELLGLATSAGIVPPLSASTAGSAAHDRGGRRRSISNGRARSLSPGAHPYAIPASAATSVGSAAAAALGTRRTSLTPSSSTNSLLSTPAPGRPRTLSAPSSPVISLSGTATPVSGGLVPGLAGLSLPSDGLGSLGTLTEQNFASIYPAAASAAAAVSSVLNYPSASDALSNSLASMSASNAAGSNNKDLGSAFAALSAALTGGNVNASTSAASLLEQGRSLSNASVSNDIASQQAEAFRNAAVAYGMENAAVAAAAMNARSSSTPSLGSINSFGAGAAGKSLVGASSGNLPPTNASTSDPSSLNSSASSLTNAGAQSSGGNNQTLPFTCKHCQRGFARKHDMLRHERLHDGVRITCQTCGRTFARADGLKRHLRTSIETWKKGHTGAGPNGEVCGIQAGLLDEDVGAGANAEGAAQGLGYEAGLGDLAGEPGSGTNLDLLGFPTDLQAAAAAFQASLEGTGMNGMGSGGGGGQGVYAGGGMTGGTDLFGMGASATNAGSTGRAGRGTGFYPTSALELL